MHGKTLFLATIALFDRMDHIQTPLPIAFCNFFHHPFSPLFLFNPNLQYLFPVIKPSINSPSALFSSTYVHEKIWMIGTSILHQTHLLSPLEDQPVFPDLSLKLKEQECLSLLKKCKNMEEFKLVHAQILKWGLFWNSYCASSLLATCTCSDWGSMDYACSIFREIDEPGTFEFNTMIRGFVKYMELENALLMYDEMLEIGVQSDCFTYPTLLKACAGLGSIVEGMEIHGHIFKLGLEGDLFVLNSLISMYGKCGKIEQSCAVFKQMDQRDVASWSAIIAAHACLGMWCECLILFGEMISEGSCRPEESIFVSVLSACSHLGALDVGRCTHGLLSRNIGGLNVIVQTSLIDMYVKCGCIWKGLSIFRRMTEKNQLSYSVIISGLGMHGQGREALRIFGDMLDDGLEPDGVVYIGVLNACSLAGLVEEGLKCLHMMKCNHGIEPAVQHYGCIVDLMGRAGMLNEALEFITSMPIEPNDIVWRSLLCASKIHQNVEIGEIAANQLFQLNSQNPGDYVVLSNIYAKAQRWEDAASIRAEMACKGFTQTPGFSLVEVKRNVYKLVSPDKPHHQCGDTYEMLQQVEWQLKFEGYSPDTSQVMLDIDEEEKRQRLKYHCQKLAIAFALVHTSQGTPIRIVRNVRMCNDCHSYTKLVSVIYQRGITVRDRNHFHHFKDGACSCRDYW